MQENINKYLWDGRENISDEFVIRRIVEYAAFPVLLKMPFDRLRDFLLHTDPDRLRTSEKRREFIRVIRPRLETADSLENAVFQMIEDYFRE